MPPLPPFSATTLPAETRLRVAGKFFQVGDKKTFLRGICYGPFQPNAQGEPYPEHERMCWDLAHIRAMGFDTVRLYELPPETVLDQAEALGLRLLISIPWTAHVDFLRTRAQRHEIERRIIEAVRRLKGRACVAAFLVGNEIDKTLVRWMGPVRVQRFLERLITLARLESPEHLISYATYPSTEYLIPRNADFLAVNIYLEQPERLTAYLQRLQNLAGNKPVVVTEFGLDVSTHGEQAQADTFLWEHACIQRAGVAGNVWFSYTDEWYRWGAQVTPWQFGLVDIARKPRPACEAILQRHAEETTGAVATPAITPEPRISVIVCTHNGTFTLASCLDSLCRLRYPDHEVLVIDDGSTQDIASIVSGFPQVIYHRQDHAGLSVARNLGAHLATGTILAYTDDDCLADEDWLTHLAEGFEDPQWAAAGGPNIPPPPRNRIEAIVAAAPGAPAHVLLNDIEAEHLPGCNFAVRKEALLSIGGFHAPFTTAGDDVDICWRLRDAGGKLRFVPSAMVWHHRRFTIQAYLRQQRGYGKAEALLMKEHPDRFGPLGGARWRGAIYGDWQLANTPVEGAIFHGPFGNGLFQGIYANPSRCWLDWMSGVLWIALGGIALLFHQPAVAAAILALSLALATCRMRHLPAFPFVLGGYEKMLLLGLCWWQPVAREWARIKGMIRLRARPTCKPALREVFVPARPRKLSVAIGEMAFWNDEGLGRDALLKHLPMAIANQGQAIRTDDGWRLFDVEGRPQGLISSAVISGTEYHSEKRCLTRVRILLRLEPQVFGFLALVFLPVFTQDGRDASVLLLVNMTLAMVVILISVQLIKRRMKKAIMIAAAEASLTPYSAKCDSTQTA